MKEYYNREIQIWKFISEAVNKAISAESINLANMTIEEAYTQVYFFKECVEACAERVDNATEFLKKYEESFKEGEN